MSRKFNLKSILGEVPEDEFEDIESITEPVPTEAMMGILKRQTEITRVKTLVAPSPEQLDIKVNKYLEEIETKTEIKLETCTTQPTTKATPSCWSAKEQADFPTVTSTPLF